ncbi:MAG: RNA-binding S4 domain-containing protein [Rubrivivax sp.]|nr:RNA-binding S4 domain-containing protein [Rubrivivax sp.]
MTSLDFALRGEFIPLDALLKATGLADSGGRAKALVAAGQVHVDGRQELRKTCKLRAGQCVQYGDWRIRLTAGPDGGAGRSDVGTSGSGTI